MKHMTSLSIGQAMDIAWHRGLVEEVTEDQYMQMCAYKTGSVARFAVEIACILAGVSPGVRGKLARFGETIGVAFQIQDDILNLVGDEKLYGKEIGGDITEGKRTLMVVYALRRLEPSKRERLKEILNMHTQDPQLIKEAIGMIKETGAIEYAKKTASNIMQESWREADNVLNESESKRKLRLLAEYLIERSR
ncbi:MAG TPA: polyprenyl synthetase family protein [Candidatus Caldiarchaeum subterraneum]|uniref:Polyprenyl synthetase family protein n=1 Tax=Caldiarchaeum subterraneum TaxID=311458 RepID=A0A832ZXH6_CALS0|nr:polyprenyl synthetase family protein [Candidatus Caldarchaeum subterraneum]